VSIEKRLAEMEAKAVRLTTPDLNGCSWDLTQLSDAELLTLRDLALKAAKPGDAAKWRERFDHQRFAELFRHGRQTE
jgi:hypothetical protein